MEYKQVWWKEAVGYQIYPASFKDSNNDGLGDINGIIEKLDYLKDLGVDFIWINPVYASPAIDNGYDISDYQDIMGIFGTMEDFDHLLEEAHNRGLKIIMDLVINHTSDQHQWFIESRKSKDNPYRDYYIWEEGTATMPPSNWESIFGGSAWEYDEQTHQHYLHVFAREQPDLNWSNEAVRKELFTMIEWWLDKGIDGFRLDAISHIKKEDISVEGTTNPYSPFQNVKGIEEYLEELKAVFKKYDIMTVGEASGVTAEQGPQWVGDQGYFDMIFEFDHISLWNKEEGHELDVVQLKAALSSWQKSLDGIGWNALYMENHDVPRSVSVFGKDYDPFWDLSAKALAMMYMLYQGTPFIYQGQEIGMTNMAFQSIEEIDAVDSIQFYEGLKIAGMDEEQAMWLVRETTRDNSRTPMQWDDSRYAGFSEHKPWLIVNPNKERINVAEEEKDPNSVLNFYKQLIQIRKNHKGLIYGSFKEYLPDNPEMVIYERTLGEESYLILVNLTPQIATFRLPDDIFYGEWDLLLCNMKEEQKDLPRGHFRGYEARLFKKGNR